MKLSEIKKLPFLGIEEVFIDGHGLVDQHMYLDSAAGLLYFVIYIEGFPPSYRTVERSAKISIDDIKRAEN